MASCAIGEESSSTTATGAFFTSSDMGLPEDHPSVQRGLLFAVLPCIVMTVAPKDLASKVLPALKDAEGLADDLMRYVFAGLDAIAKEAAPVKAGRRR